MHRLLVGTELLSQESPALPAAAARHLKVLRPRPGEAIELFDGHGRFRTFEVRGPGFGEAGCLVPVSEPLCLEPLAANLTLFACVTKGSRWDWTIEKATELGVTRIVPVISERTIVRIPPAERAAKRERWMRIAEDAARQSDAKFLPAIDGPIDFEDVLPLVRQTTCFVGALMTPPARPLAEAVASRVTHEGAGGEGGLAAFIGPEGDFTPDELAVLLPIAIPTSFGPTILRAETAAIYAVSVLASAMRK